MTVGDRIHSLRTELHLTFQELGDRVGVGASTVRKWEIGLIKDIKTDKIQKLASALNTTVEYLMGWPEKNVSVTGSTVNGVVGSNSGEVNILQGCSKEEAELLRIFKALDVRGRSKLMNYAWSLEEGSK